MDLSPLTLTYYKHIIISHSHIYIYTCMYYLCYVASGYVYIVPWTYYTRTRIAI